MVVVGPQSQKLSWGVCVCVWREGCRVCREGKEWTHTNLFISALSYVGRRSSSNLAIVEVKMLSGFSPMEGTIQSVSLFCFFI